MLVKSHTGDRESFYKGYVKGLGRRSIAFVHHWFQQVKIVRGQCHDAETFFHESTDHVWPIWREQMTAMRKTSCRFFSRHAVRLGDLANGRSESKAVLVRHRGGLTLTVLLEHPFQNDVALVPCKIDIDVR